MRRGLRDRRRLLPEGHRRIPESENLLGHCLARLGRMGEARELLEGGYHTLLSDFGPEYVETQRAGERLRAFYESTGQRDEAATLSTSS